MIIPSLRPALFRLLTAGTELNPPVFRVGERVCTVEDLLAAAERRGELSAAHEAWIERERAAEIAASLDLDPDPTAVEAAINAFRYARDLVSAEECEGWLAARALSFADLHACFNRRLRAALAPPAAGSESEAPELDPLDPDPLDPDSLAAFRADLLLSDDFIAWSRALAWRIALAAEAAVLPAAALPLDEHAGADLDTRFAAACADLATPARRARELGAQRLFLLRVEGVLVRFDQLDAAREAVLCTREDRLPLAEVAAANGYAFEGFDAFLGDLSPEWQNALVSAAPGDVPPPIPEADGAVVLQLLHKYEPSLASDPVCARLDAQTRSHFFGELVAKHIRWVLAVEAEA